MLKRVAALCVLVVAPGLGTIAGASTSAFNPNAPAVPALEAPVAEDLWLQFALQGARAGDVMAILEEAASHGLRDDYGVEALQRLQEQIVRGESDRRTEFEGLMTDALLRLFRDLRPQLAKDFADAGDADLLGVVLVEAASSGNLRDFYESLIPRHPQYAQLRSALARLEEPVTRNQPEPIGRGPTLRRGDSGARVQALRARLLEHSHHQRLHPEHFDASLEQAVIEYQQLHGLDADGIVGRRTQQHLDMNAAQRAARIRLALAQWRELPVSLGDEYVHVNIPEYRLEMIRGGETRLQMRVVVGSKKDPTPAFNDEIEYLVFNPYWHVPRRIALEELVPKAVDTPGYLTRQNYEVLRQGSLVEESSIEWAAMDAAQFDYRIRQRPGPGNALGAVKFLFPNAMNIYLHDSPSRGLYDRTVRAFSHGCIRLENPAALAEALLERQGDWDGSRVDALMGKGSRRQINLEQPVPVYLTYITTKVTESGELALFDDVYGRDAAQLPRYL